MAKKQLSDEAKELLEKVNASIKRGKYFIAIVDYKPRDDVGFDYFYIQNEFPDSEIFPSLQKISSMYKEQKMKAVGGDKIE